MFLFSYFRTEAEALHLALSEDGFSFEGLNGNCPVLEPLIEGSTMRDPFILQAEDGGFHLLATEGWSGQSILHAATDDLIDWSDQKSIPVMSDIPNTRNSWAPEAFYGSEDGLYRVIWSSTVNEDTTDETRDHRIWACETRDFETFTASHLFFDPGYNVIDATVTRLGDMYLMAFKDERGENRVDTDFKAIRVATSLRPGGPFESVSDLITPSPVEGPTIYQKDGLLVMLYDHFLEDRYGGALSEDGRNWQVSDVEIILQDRPRHGSVVQIDDALGMRLRDHYG